MKNIFQAFAKYNGSVNQSIIGLLEPLEKEQVMKETKAYYPSIFETLFHNLIADLNWLKRYRDVFKETPPLFLGFFKLNIMTIARAIRPISASQAN